jgi:hypothetical protein
VAIRNYHDVGNTATMRANLASLAVCLDRLGRYEPATMWVHEFNTAMAHLREVLGDQTYASLARKGETMTTATMVTYAYDQIEQVRAELSAVSK